MTTMYLASGPVAALIDAPHPPSPYRNFRSPEVIACTRNGEFQRKLTGQAADKRDKGALRDRDSMDNSTRPSNCVIPRGLLTPLTTPVAVELASQLAGTPHPVPQNRARSPALVDTY